MTKKVVVIPSRQSKDHKMFEITEMDAGNSAVIKVIGVGGGGGNAVNHMLEKSISGVDFICANTDAQALKQFTGNDRVTALQIGQEATKGLGAGANPEVGRKAALEDESTIKSILEGADMVFITAGMGGGTGTGAAPVIAQIAKEMGILTVSVVTRPFPFEGGKRRNAAVEGIKELSQHVDSLITIPNDKLLTVLGKNATLISAFAAANDVLHGAVQGISELITSPGVINVDFADVNTVMQSMGMAMMGSATASGENRATEAAEKAIRSPLLEDVDLNGARGILVNITGGPDLSIGEFNDVGATIHEFASPDATIVVGTSIDMGMEDEIRVTVVAAGLDNVETAKTPQHMSHSAPQMRTASGHASQRPSLGQAAAKSHAQEGKQSRETKKPSDVLDIPAFLKKRST